MLTGWTFFRRPSRVPLSMVSALRDESLRIERQPIWIGWPVRIVAEIVNAGPEQPDGPPASVCALEQLYCARREDRGVAGRRRAMAARDRRKVRVTDLDGHGASIKVLAVQPMRRPAGHFDDFRPDD